MCESRIGIVLSVDASRPARNSIDWHRLLEVCALTDTLILDEDGVYSPRDYNDRLLLGLLCRIGHKRPRNSRSLGKAGS